MFATEDYLRRDLSILVENCCWIRYCCPLQLVWEILRAVDHHHPKSCHRHYIIYLISYQFCIIRRHMCRDVRNAQKMINPQKSSFIYLTFRAGWYGKCNNDFGCWGTLRGMFENVRFYEIKKGHGYSAQSVKQNH